MLRFIDLGEKGIAHLKEDYWGYIDFFEQMKKAKNFIVSSYTYIPSDFVSSYKVDDFDSGGRYSRDNAIVKEMEKKFDEKLLYPVAFYVLSDFIDTYMNSFDDKICYFNEFIFTKDSLDEDMNACRVEREWKQNYVFMENHMAYHLSGRNLVKDDYIDMIGYSSTAGPPFASGFITDYLPKGKVTTQEEIQRIFEGITIVFAGIYDAEGVMVAETEKGIGEVSKIFSRLGYPYTEEKL